MKVSYKELPEYQFPHWIQATLSMKDDNMDHIMNINQWCGSQYGDLGINWGYERVYDTSTAPKGLNPVRVRLYHTTIHYSWRFKNKADAMAFKLAWGGV